METTIEDVRNENVDLHTKVGSWLIDWSTYWSIDWLIDWLIIFCFCIDFIFFLSSLFIFNQIPGQQSENRNVE